MQKTSAAAPRNEGPKPKAAPRWRDLTDEERWARIYRGRAQKAAAAPKTLQQAVGLSLPAYCLHMAVADCHKTLQATIRHDVHVSIVAGVAKVSSLVPDAWRDHMADTLHKEYRTIASKGFYIDNKEFLYAIAGATVKLADDWRYPADSPACMAALLIKEDAESDEGGDWCLAKAHALQMVGHAYNALTDTGLYGYPEAVLKVVD